MNSERNGYHAQKNLREKALINFVPRLSLERDWRRGWALMGDYLTHIKHTRYFLKSCTRHTHKHRSNTPHRGKASLSTCSSSDTAKTFFRRVFQPVKFRMPCILTNRSFFDIICHKKKREGDLSDLQCILSANDALSTEEFFLFFASGRNKQRDEAENGSIFCQS